MIIKALKHILGAQRGTALAEVLISVAITGLLGTGTLMAISSIYDQNTLQTVHMSAVMQAENAVSWFSRDAQMAQSINPTGETGLPVTMSWVDWDGGSHQVIYEINSDSLVRTHLDGGQSYQTVVATDILADNQTNCTYSGGVVDYRFTIRVDLDGFSASETRTGEVKPRAAM